MLKLDPSEWKNEPLPTKYSIIMALLFPREVIWEEIALIGVQLDHIYILSGGYLR